MSNVVTKGIRVAVKSEYLPGRSAPAKLQYVFAYTVVISNESEKTVQLRSRHWVITDGRGRTEEVRGKGVIGEQPTLNPGETFQYTSGCVLETPTGTMHGTYQMHYLDGASFDAEISPFELATPQAKSKQLVN